MEKAFEKISAFFKDIKDGLETHIWPSFGQIQPEAELEDKLKSLPGKFQNEYYICLEREIQRQRRHRNVITFTTFFLVTQAEVFWPMAAAGAYYWYTKNFTIPQLSHNVYRKVMLKYRLANHERIMDRSNVARSNRMLPRSMEIPFDPSNLTLEHLKTGYLLDFEMKTWCVTRHIQYDWDNGTSERFFKLMQHTDQKLLIVRKESEYLQLMVGDKVNVYAIDEDIDTDILMKQRPKNVLSYKGERYFRDEHREGYAFNITERELGIRTNIWDYYNEERKKMVRVEQVERREFKAFYAEIVSPYNFTEILPPQDTDNPHDDDMF
ncbi:DUF4178 domain-containing protein [Limibacter armeniacum]|uniref:DUF4178 domain-containing protein n=1 Tax=Limibacter armeniacum TaxID=466084 RepID=UPI002FE5AF36